MKNFYKIMIMMGFLFTKETLSTSKDTIIASATESGVTKEKDLDDAIVKKVNHVAQQLGYNNPSIQQTLFSMVYDTNRCLGLEGNMKANVKKSNDILGGEGSDMAKKVNKIFNLFGGPIFTLFKQYLNRFSPAYSDNPIKTIASGLKEIQDFATLETPAEVPNLVNKIMVLRNIVDPNNPLWDGLKSILERLEMATFDPSTDSFDDFYSVIGKYLPGCINLQSDLKDIRDKIGSNLYNPKITASSYGNPSVLGASTYSAFDLTSNPSANIKDMLDDFIALPGKLPVGGALLVPRQPYGSVGDVVKSMRYLPPA